MVIKDIQFLTDNFYNYNTVKKLLAISFVKKLNPINIPKDLRLDTFKGCKYAYLKDDIEMYMAKYNDIKDSPPKLNISHLDDLCNNYCNNGFGIL